MRTNKSAFTRKILYLVAVSVTFVLSLNVFLITLSKLNIGSDADLRNRMVGTRVALRGIDPYRYNWTSGDPLEYLDPLTQLKNPLSRLTITPLLLSLHVPASAGVFSNTVMAWFVFEWIVIGTTLLLLFNVFPQHKKGVLLIGLIFIASPIWIVSVWYGQVYFLYTFLLATILYLNTKKQTIPSVVLLSFLVVLRPTYIVLAVFLLLFSTFRHHIKVFATTATAFVVVPMLLFSIHIWPQYVSSMFIFLGTTVVQERAFNPSTVYPSVIEGWTIPSGDQSFPLHYENSINGMLIRSLNVQLPGTLFLLAILMTIAACIYAAKKLRVQSFSALFLIGVSATLLCEYLLPVKRYVYADIQWLVPITIFVSEEKLRRKVWQTLSQLRSKF